MFNQLVTKFTEENSELKYVYWVYKIDTFIEYIDKITINSIFLSWYINAQMQFHYLFIL